MSLPQFFDIARKSALISLTEINVRAETRNQDFFYICGNHILTVVVAMIQGCMPCGTELGDMIAKLSAIVCWCIL